jgi:glycine oxidase
VTIVVVGSGIIGCSIAHELASRGARVHVVDPRSPGEGATRASAGTLAPYIEGHSTALRMLGVRSLRLFDGFMERVIARSGQAVEYVRAGTLQVARSDAEESELVDVAASLAEAGVSHQLLDTGSVRDLEPGLSAVSRALLIPEHAHVAAQALTHALQGAARNLGAQWTTARVGGVRQAGAGAEAVTAGSTIAGDAVVIAAGSWSGEIKTPSREPDRHPPSTIHQPVRPIRGQLVHLRLDHQPVSRVIWGAECYLVPWHDGSLLAGATVEDVGFDESATPDAVRLLAQAAAALVPAARGARIHDVRVGLRPRTPDGLPVIGRSSTMPSVFYATGHYRTGVLLAPLTAALIADLVLERSDDAALALVRPDRLGL